MDQLKPIIDALKQHRFWIFCGVTLIACTVVYYMITGSLAEEETEAVQKIRTAASNAQTLQNAGVEVNPAAEDGAGESRIAHPNEETEQEMVDVVEAAAKATRDAWLKKYATQEPYQVFEKNLINEPTADFESFLPVEAIEFDPEGETEGLLPETVRINFRDNIRKILPSLASIVGAVWKPAFEKGAATPAEIVIWKKDNQEYWHDRFTNFKSDWNLDATNTNIPYTLQVMYRSEDIWILRSILTDVIAKTVFSKGDIYANDLAPIKQIDHILIGKLAEKPDSSRGGVGGGSMMGGSSGSGMGGMMPSSGAPSSKGKRSGGANVDDSADPAAGRYVDNEGNLVKAKDYRALYKSSNTDKKKVHLKISKRVQVRIGLQMDTREIPRLLANCANSPFPIEVQSLRINKHTASKVSGGGGGGGMSSGGGMNSGFGSSAEDRAGGLMAGGGSGAGTAPGAGGSAGNKSGKKGGSQEMAEDEEGYIKPVEIYGYLNIYNKVDDKVFSILEEEESTTP